MKQKDTKWILGLLGSILLGLSTWVLVEVVELRSTVSMMNQELLNIDKQFGRVYNFIDKFGKNTDLYKMLSKFNKARY